AGVVRVRVVELVLRRHRVVESNPCRGATGGAHGEVGGGGGIDRDAGAARDAADGRVGGGDRLAAGGEEGAAVADGAGAVAAVGGVGGGDCLAAAGKQGGEERAGAAAQRGVAGQRSTAVGAGEVDDARVGHVRVVELIERGHGEVEASAGGGRGGRADAEVG